MQNNYNINETYTLCTGKKAAGFLEKQHQLFLPHGIQQLQKAQLQQGHCVWDIGCGSGTMTEYLAKFVGASSQVFALDFNQKQLDIAKKRIEEAGLNNVTFVLGDITDLSEVPSLSADVVYCRLTLMHLQRPDVAVRRMAKLLKSGGRLCLQESTMSTAMVFPFSAIIQNIFQSLVSLGAYKDLDYDIGRKLSIICLNSKSFNEIESYTTQEQLSSKNAQELLISCINQCKDKGYETGIITQEQFQLWETEISALTNNHSLIYFCAEQTHIIASV
jgi:ubiquinone/menaquinone biosynthesis C-methylase UbiE